MARVFTVACSTLAAVNSMNGDTITHFVTATVPSLTAFPVRLQFQLPVSECGWTNQRPVHVWFVNTSTVVKMSVQQVTYSFDNRTLSVQLATTIGHHKSSYRVLERSSRVVEDQRQINICVKLGRVPTGSDPVFEFLARNRLFSLLHVNPRCRGNVIVDTVYSSDPTPQDQALPNVQQDNLTTTSVAGREITLRQDQSYAVRAGDQDIPLLAIQGAFGTGKTVVGALITARVAAATGSTVIATATTNTAVAQFADTLLRLDHFRDLSIVRFASDSALIEGAPRTPVDLDVLLKRMATDFGDVLFSKDLEACETYAAGRELLEAAMFNPESTLHLSEEERDQYRIAEQHVSATTETVVSLLLALREPGIFCMTTAALSTLRTTAGSSQATSTTPLFSSEMKPPRSRNRRSSPWQLDSARPVTST